MSLQGVAGGGWPGRAGWTAALPCPILAHPLPRKAQVMNVSLVLLAALAAPPAGLPNLDFSAGGLAHWKGDGFDLVGGPAVSSADRDGRGRRAILHRTFVVPPGAGTLHFSAHASRDNERLNVFLEAAG